MIIKRRYVEFRILLEHDEGFKEVFDKLFIASYGKNSQDWYYRLIWHCLYESTMDWAFKNIGKLYDYCEMMDQIRPFDNGLTLSDGRKGEVLYKDEDQLLLVLEGYFDGAYYTIQVLDLNKDNIEIVRSK